MTLYVGTAGWSVPKACQRQFPTEGSHLERYSARMNCVEINSSFYRTHRPATYQRWAESVPDHFRFSAKVPRKITHENRLRDSQHELEEFLTQVTTLGYRLGSLLIQLPPSLKFGEVVVRNFFKFFRERYDGRLLCEPRHQTWFSSEANSSLKQFRVAQVAADPPVIDQLDEPRGSNEIHYYRLHGSPKIYYSNYDSRFLNRLRTKVIQSLESKRDVWCIFDNTALGHALGNALEFLAMSDPVSAKNGLQDLNL